MSGTLKAWASPAKRAAFEAACEKIFKGAQCFVDGVKAGSVVIDFTIVQYADADAGAAGTPSLAEQLADAAVMARFSSEVLAATGSTIEAAPTVISITAVSADGTARVPLSGGAVAGIVIMCVVVAATTIVGGVYVYRRKRALPTATKTDTRV